MAVNVSDFTSAPKSTADKLVYGDGSTKASVNGALLDYSVSGQFHTEPIYEIGNEQIVAYENYKQADQYTGHAVRANPSFDLEGAKEYYVLEENGAHYASGKTYYLGYETILVPNI